MKTNGIFVDENRIRRALFPTEHGRIINSRLQNDFYKPTMGQFFARNYRDVVVESAFINRTTSIRLADEIRIEDLMVELDHFAGLKYTEEELLYLASIRNEEKPMFEGSYIDDLRGSTLPLQHVTIENGQFKITTKGQWYKVTDCEVPDLAIISALLTEAQMKRKTKREQGEIVRYTTREIGRKIALLKENPNVMFSDFSTRRAGSPLLQEYIVELCLEHIWKQFVGTSNVYLAKKFGAVPSGTIAHERDGVIAALAESDEELRQSPIKALRQWWKMYGRGLSIILPDTFGSNWMFKNLSREFAVDWRGMRQDSMPPIEFGEKQIQFYKKHGQDPREHLIIPSDGLTVELMIQLTHYFFDRIRISHGLGGGLGNDTSLSHPSIVMKAVFANGRPCVKLSDNLAKSVGPKAEKDRYIRVFDYHNEFEETPVR